MQRVEEGAHPWNGGEVLGRIPLGHTQKRIKIAEFRYICAYGAIFAVLLVQTARLFRLVRALVRRAQPVTCCNPQLILLNDANPMTEPRPVERLIFARNFRKARKAAGLTQNAIRQRTGFAQSWISEVENGVSAINIDNMAALASAVETPLWKLLVP